MQAALIDSPYQARNIHVEQPEPGADDVLIQVKAAGICGTDLHIYQGEYEATYPIIPGHEFSGVVAAVGENVTRYKVGDRVTADPNIPCNRCPACQRNEPNQCHNLQATGVTRSGAFAEYVTVPEGVVFPIGDMSFEAAAMIEPLACVVWGLKRVQVQPGDSVLVMGAGPMGCLLMQAVRAAGAAHVVVTDVVPSRLEQAKALGATETFLADEFNASDEFDIVADVTGVTSVLEAGFEYVRPRGKVWIFGVCPPEAQASFNPYQVFRKDLSIIGSFAVCRTFQESIAMIQGGAVQVEPLISHRFPLSDFEHALDVATNDPDRMKVQFQF